MQPGTYGCLHKELLSTKWVLQFYHKGSEQIIAQGANGPAYITLSQGDAANSGMLTGSSGCNRLVGGTFKLTAPNQILIGPMGLTRMACYPEPQPPEYVFVEALAKATTFEVAGMMLTIQTSAGEVLVFKGE